MTLNTSIGSLNSSEERRGTDPAGPLKNGFRGICPRIFVSAAAEYFLPFAFAPSVVPGMSLKYEVPFDDTTGRFGDKAPRKACFARGWRLSPRPQEPLRASERKGAATAHAMASVRARAELARFFMLDIIPFSPRFVVSFAADFCREKLST